MFSIEERSFTNKISLIDTVILGIGSTIGAGIFVLLSASIEIAGPAVIIAFIINSILALIIAFNYAEAASVNPVNGGGFSFVEAAYGKKALFLGWIVWLGNTSYAALTAVGIGEYIQAITQIPGILVSISILALFTFLNSVGSKSVASIEKPLTIGLALLLIFTGVYLFSNPIDGGFTPFAPNGWWTILPATSLLFVTFTGFEMITTISAEVKKPRTNIPKALLYTVVVVSIIYLLIVAAALYSTDATRLGGSDVGLIEAIKGSPIMEGVIITGAILAMLSSLNVALMAGSRNVYALSRDGFLPKEWGKISERFEAPVKAVLLTAGIALILVFTGQVELIASVSNISYMLMVSSVGLAVIKFRQVKENSSFRVPFYPYTTYLCIGLPIILIPFLETAGIIIGFSWLIIGVMIYLFKMSQKPKIK